MRSGRMGRPRRPETGKGIGDGELPAEEKWWGRGAIRCETITGSGLRRNTIPQRGFARMPLSSATQPLECHPREFGAFYSPSTPPFSLFLSRSRLGRTEREPRMDRALGLFSSVAEVPFRNCCHGGHRNSDSKMKFMLDTVAMSKHKMCHF